MVAVMSVEWKDKYFEEKFKNVDASIGRVLEKVEENTALTKEISASGKKNTERIIAIEAEVYKDPDVKRLPAFYKDPKVIQIILFIVFIIAGIVAMILGIDIKGIL